MHLHQESIIKALVFLAALIVITRASSAEPRVCQTALLAPPELAAMPFAAAGELTVDWSGLTRSASSPSPGWAQLAARLTAFSHVRPKTVLYPAAGFDAATPFLVFPEATTVIGLDWHPFVGQYRDSAVARLPKERTHYALYHEVDELFTPGVAGAIVARLRGQIPGFHLRHVGYFEEARAFAWTSETKFLIEDFFGDRPAPSTSLNGWVEFDTGPGTTVRRYIHVQRLLGETAPSIEEDPWLARVLAGNYQALFLRAGMHIFTSGHPQSPRFVRDYFFTEPAAHGLLIVDTDREVNWNYLGELHPKLRVRSQDTPILEGYGRGADAGTQLIEIQ